MESPALLIFFQAISVTIFSCCNIYNHVINEDKYLLEGGCTSRFGWRLSQEMADIPTILKITLGVLGFNQDISFLL